MNKSESIDELAKALSLAQKEIDLAKKEAVNPFFKKNYADLTSVWDACRDHLTKHGLSVTQMPGYSDGRISLETVLLHSSGQWISGVCSAKPMKDDPQQAGSCITYLRRYSLAAMVGVCSTEVDDDANSASDAKGEVVGNGKKKEVVEKKVEPPKQEESRSGIQKWLDTAKHEKERIGETAYYTILGGHGFEKSNQVHERNTQLKIYSDWSTIKGGTNAST